MSLYLLLKYVHILMAIVAVGANATYGIWMARGAREPQHLSHVLNGVRFLDSRIANPAYGVLLITGLAMVYAGKLPWRTPWIEWAVILYIVAVVLGVRGYFPALLRQIAAAESPGAMSEKYRRAEASSRTLGLLFMVVVLVILFLMVAKPGLGG
jgi:uncharacterized membrane protein